MSTVMGRTPAVGASHGLGQRRIRRFELVVPIDVIALRSGVPASMPGRTVNVSEGGVATVLAGELSPGESVGLEFRLPLVSEPIQAKAIVRHYSLMQCGLQFVGMSPEQETALRTWTRKAQQHIAVESPVIPTTSAISKGTPRSKAAGRPHGPRWILLTVFLIVGLLGAVAWWSWNSGWRDLEGGAAAGNASVPLDVSSSVMSQRIVHRVDPIYPNEAIRTRLQGEVTLEVLIGEDGTVRDAYAVSGPDLLRAAAVDAVKWWRFEPYQVNGRAAPVHTLIEVDFRLNR